MTEPAGTVPVVAAEASATLAPLGSAARAHDLQDHALGRDALHRHVPGVEYDHEHDDFAALGPLEEDPLWIQDHVSLTSVGIDIGSSGTLVIFSRVNLRRLGEELSSRFAVVSRETLFQSEVALTPYESDCRIDAQALGGILDQAYAAAGMTSDAVDTGAVILTGEALRRENAATIARIVAEHGGELVCAAAGHHMEAMLAAFGSGAAALSALTARRLLNIDIGGGTTKLAIVERGRVVGSAAFHVGGRLLVIDAGGRIIRLDPAGALLAAQAGFQWKLGQLVEPAELDALAESVATTLIGAVRAPAAAGELYLTNPLPDLDAIEGVVFSGGVAEYIYGREQRDFGDLGRRLGRALTAHLSQLPWPLQPAKECIRATALGASEYSVQLSGNTLYASNRAALLPRRNLQVLKPPCELSGRIDPQAVACSIRDHLALFDLAAQEREFALAFRWGGEPSYERVAAFARAIAQALAPSIGRGQPLYLILDRDIAQTLGGVLREELRVGSEVLVVDGIMLVDFDYVDLGRIRLPSHTVPVTVKSLLF